MSTDVTWLDVADLADHLPLVGSLWLSRQGIEYCVQHVRPSGSDDDGALISLRGTSKTANGRTRYRCETFGYFRDSFRRSSL